MLRYPVLSFVCWKWKPIRGYRSKFEGEHVNILRRMIARNYHAPFKFTCITDDPAGIDPDIQVIPLWDEFSAIPSPHDHGPRRVNPSCYRRLRMFRRDAAEWLGDRICSIDLDTVITADITAMMQRPEAFIIYGDTHPTSPYNGSLILFDAGCRPQLYEDFHPQQSPALALKKGYYGSDQAWIGACLGPDEAKWTRRDGVYSYRNELGPHHRELPPNAKIVVFHGHTDPDHPDAQAHEWVRLHYR